MKKTKRMLSVLLVLLLVFSIMTTAMVSAGALSKPNLTVSNKSNGIRAEWNKISDAVKYRVYYKSELDYGWSYVDTANNYYPLLGTVQGRKYAFQIQPIGRNNAMGPYSAVKNIVFYPPANTVKPNLTLSNKSNGIRAEWGKINGVTNYIVYYRKSTVKTWSSVTTTNNYYPYLSATEGTTYCFQVLPMIGSTKGKYSSVVSITFIKLSTAKPIVTLSNKTNGIRVEWNQVGHANSYRVFYRDYFDYDWNHVDTNKTYFAFLDAEFGNEYSFQVLPLFGGTKGSYSKVNRIEFIPEVTYGIDTVEFLDYETNPDGLYVYWDDIYDADGYAVTMRDDAGWCYNYDNGLLNSAFCPFYDDNIPYYLSVRTMKYKNGSYRYGPPSEEYRIGTIEEYDIQLIDDDGFVDESYLTENDDIDLTVWVPDRAVSLTRQQVNRFKQHYPDKDFSINVVAMGESDAAMMVMNDPGSAADVFGFPSDMMNRLQGADVLSYVPLALNGTVANENVENTVNAASEYSLLSAYPETADNGYYLVYNKSVVSDNAAKTLEGILAACKAKNKQFVLDSGNGFYSCMFAFTGGVLIDGFEDDGYTQKFVDYDEDEAVDTLMAFAKLMKDYKNTYSSQDAANISTGFKNGRIGAGVDGSWNYQADKSALGNNFGAAKLPTIKVNGTDKQIIPIAGYKYLGVNSYSYHQRAAHMLAYYLSSEACQLERAQQLGWGPSNLNAQEAVSDDPVMKALADQSHYSVPQVNVSGTFWTPMGTLGSEMYKDSWDPANRSKTTTLLRRVVENIKDY